MENHVEHRDSFQFEGLTEKDAKSFPRQFAVAIPVGADLSLVPAKFMINILNDTLSPFTQKENPNVVKAVRDVMKLWQDVIDGKYLGKNKELESAAWS